MSEPSADPSIITRRDGALAEIVLSNPARHNAISLPMWEQLRDALKRLAEEDVRVLIVTGAGERAFAAGADISGFEKDRASAEGVKRYNALTAETSERLYNFPRPTIAKIRGYCIGGGLNLAMCCDMRLAASDATFAIPAARLGLGYGLAGVQRLAEAVGLPMAMDIFFTARRLGAEEALRIGLVNRVVAPSELDADVAATAGRIAKNAPLTIAAIKAIARELGKPSAARDLARIDRMVEACFASSDYAEGRRAFMEKREPNFTGR
jgi:enoyl-CoA hydratase/carnithine racemase